jgi:hypothetical protein
LGTVFLAAPRFFLAVLRPIFGSLSMDSRDDGPIYQSICQQSIC